MTCSTFASICMEYIGVRPHVEAMYSNPTALIRYCKKEGYYYISGDPNLR